MILQVAARIFAIFDQCFAMAFSAHMHFGFDNHHLKHPVEFR